MMASKVCQALSTEYVQNGGNSNIQEPLCASRARSEGLPGSRCSLIWRALEK